MERYVLLVLTMLCSYVTFSYAEETKEMAMSVPHLEAPPKVCVYVPLNQNHFTAYINCALIRESENIPDLCRYLLTPI